MVQDTRSSKLVTVRTEEARLFGPEIVAVGADGQDSLVVSWTADHVIQSNPFVTGGYTQSSRAGWSMVLDLVVLRERNSQNLPWKYSVALPDQHRG